MKFTIAKISSNNQNGYIICLIWSPYENRPVQLEPAGSPVPKNWPVQPILIGPIAWTICDTNRTALVSVFYRSNHRYYAGGWEGGSGWQRMSYRRHRKIPLMSGGRTAGASCTAVTAGTYGIHADSH